MLRRHSMYHTSWGDRPFQKGDLKYVILGLIAEKPRHGYEIIRILEDRSHGFYAPSPGAVYPTLQFLEEAGYVSSAEQDGKKTYTITEEGRAFLNQRKDFSDRIKRHMRDLWGAKDASEVRETVIEFRRLGRLLREQHRRRVDPQKMRRIKAVLVRASEEVQGILEE